MTAPADLCEKKRRGREIRKLRRKLGWIDIPVTYDRSDLTGFGHLPLFVNFARVVGLEDSLEKRLHLCRRERSDGFTAEQMLWILAEAILYGIDRVDNISVLGTDALVPKLHDLERIPTAQAARDFLECFTEENVRELLAVNRDVISNATTRRRKPVSVSFLSDETVLTVYGKQEGAEVGYNPKKKGRRSYLARLCVIDELDVVSYAELRGGTERPLSRQGDFFDEAFAVLPENTRVTTVRLDRGHFAEKTCRYFEEERPATYYLKVKLNPRMRSDFYALDDGLFDEVPHDDREIALVRYRPSTWTRERTFVVLRRRKPSEDSDQSRLVQSRLIDEPEYEFEAIVTSDEKMSALEVFKAYNHGADVENRIRELRYEYHIDRNGSHSLQANSAHFVWKVIVHNLMSLFKRMVLPAGWARKSLKTVRAYVLKVPGVVRRVGKGVALALPVAFPLQALVQEAVEKLAGLALGGPG